VQSTTTKIANVLQSWVKKPNGAVHKETL